MTNKELKEARRKLGLTQSALGEAIGLTRKSIGEMERGQAPIELRTSLAIKYLLIEKRG